MQEKNGWDRVGNRIEKGPWSAFTTILMWVVVISMITSLIGIPLGWWEETKKVVKEEFGPRASLDKYSWFIDQANRIEKMGQDLKIFEARVADIDKQYNAYGEDKLKWPPHVTMQYNQAKQQGRDDLVALTSQHNKLVSEYNSASEKFNWSPFQTRPDKPKDRFHTYVNQ